MTTISFFKKDNNIVKVVSKGHTGYAEEGSDIVCAAVSAVLQTALLGLLKEAKKFITYKVNEKCPSFEIVIKNGIENELLEKTNLILNTAYLGIKDIAKQYKAYVKLEVLD